MFNIPIQKKERTDSSHKSFYGFYPSECFDFGKKAESIYGVEKEIRSVNNLIKLKKLYREALPSSISSKEIIRRCEYSKKILQLSEKDIDFFSNNSQRTASELVSLISLFISIMAVVLTILGEKTSGLFFVIIGIIAIIGTCHSYVKSVKLREQNSKVKEIYRNMLMCFETMEEIGKEIGEEGNS